MPATADLGGDDPTPTDPPGAAPDVVKDEDTVARCQRCGEQLIRSIDFDPDIGTLMMAESCWRPRSGRWWWCKGIRSRLPAWLVFVVEQP